VDWAKKILTLFILCGAFGCAHSQNVNKIEGESSAKGVGPQAIQDSVVLKLVKEEGRVELSNNCTKSTTKTFDGNQLLHKRIEEADFQSKTVTGSGGSGNIYQTMETLSKDGSLNLHDFAYPEIGEKIDFEFSPEGEVLKAGKYPKSSLFFVPPLPLPHFAVKKDDHWEMKSGWASEEGGLPLTVTLHATYLNQKKCGDHTCVNIGVEGEVHMDAKLEKKNGFGHKISGRFLFEPKRGLLVWSEFLSDEHLQTEGARAEVRSILRSELLSPPGYRTISREEPSCPFEPMAE
jgi:hypothetical protein